MIEDGDDMQALHLLDIVLSQPEADAAALDALEDAFGETATALRAFTDG